MKRPRPGPPANVPEGTITIGGPIGWFSLSLHVTADDLDPAAVSQILGAEPTASQSMGVPLIRSDGTVKRIPKFGRWTFQIKSAETDEWDIEEMIMMLFANFSADTEAWRQVREHGIIQLSVGLSLSGSNEEFSLSPSLMILLGERGVGLYFDVYDKEF